MIRIILNGCNGRMGQVISRLSKEDGDVSIVAGVDISIDKFKNDYPVYSTLDEVLEEAQVIIDFTNINGLPTLLESALGRKTPLVICTTGQSPEDKEKIKAAAEKIPVLTSANMSIGINLLLSLVKSAARALEDSFDIEIVEKHHNQKVDSPSGTALAIADSINSGLEKPKEYIYGRHSKTDKRTSGEIGIHAIRGGNIVGDHSVIFAGLGEVIEINHSAISRDVFGVGAIKAAKYLYDKRPGLYTMDNVVNDK